MFVEAITTSNQHSMSSTLTLNGSKESVGLLTPLEPTMSLFWKTMSDSADKDRPRTVFDIIPEEDTHLSQFLYLLHKKLELDRSYLNELERKANSSQLWTKSSIWPLISPLLSYFEDEKKNLRESIRKLALIIEALRRSPSLDNVDPGKNVEEVREAHQQEQRGLKLVRQIDAHSVSRWRSEVKGPKYSLLLEQDRNHRQAVWRQHSAAEPITDWYVKTMPTVLENHQQHAEDIKSGIQAILTHYSEVASKLSSSCSSGINENAAFVSSAFISPRHDEVEQEKSHISLRKAEYKNLVDGFRTAQPVFDVGLPGLLSIIPQVIESCKDGSGSMVWSVPEERGLA